MTNHERYNLVRQNTGYPHIIAYIITFPAHALPSREHLENRVADLQRKFPKLYARIVNARTNKPAFAANGSPWDAADIINEGTYTPAKIEANEAPGILRAEMERFESLDFDHVPMWTLTLLYGPPGVPRAYLIGMFNHLIIDGRGSLALMHALLARNTENLLPETFESPRRFDDTVNIKPGITYLAPEVFHELLLPKLPKGFQSTFGKNDLAWPGTNVNLSPFASGWSMCHVSVPTGTVARLKAQGKRYGVKTLHPVLKMAYLAALWRTFGNNSTQHFNAMTMRDERDPSLGHSQLTGIYSSSTEHHVHVNGKDRFWSCARKMAAELKSKKAIADGRYIIGVMSHLPDPEVDPKSPDFDPKAPTGWEKYFLRRTMGPIPYRQSLAFSNMCQTSLPEGATDLMWAQTASPIAPAFSVNVISHENGLRLTATFRENSAATKYQTDLMHKTWLRCIDRIITTEGDRTIAELTADNSGESAWI